MSVAKSNCKRVAAYSLLLSLHRYSNWVSGLRTATPAAIPLADREIQLIVALVDEHFQVVARMVTQLAERHSLLAAVIEGNALEDCAGAREEYFKQGVRQAESLNRLVSMVEQYLKAPEARGSTGTVAELPALS